MGIQASQLNFAGIDRFLRIFGVVIGLCALPLILFVSIMASDSGTPKAMHFSQVFFLQLLGSISSASCAPSYPHQIRPLHRGD